MPRDTDSFNARQPGSQQGKLIDLRGHYAAEQALDALLLAGEYHPGYEQLLAEAIALGPNILAATVRRLDSSRPKGFAILGRVVAEYPFRVQSVQTLMRTALDRRNSDNRRMGAMLLLNQFLGVSPPDDFLSSLHNPVVTVVNSLTGTLKYYADRPEMLLGYFRGLSAMPIELLYSMMNALSELPGSASVAALRLLALQPDIDLMHAAIEALISRSDTKALRALATLEPNLPDEAARVVSRYLQKMRLSGYAPNLLKPATSKCRALLGPVDGRGRRLLCVLVPESAGPDHTPKSSAKRRGDKQQALNRGADNQQAPQTAKAGMIGYVAVMMQDTLGILATLGSISSGADAFPGPAPIGTMHSLRSPLPDESPGLAPQSGTTRCLEVPFSYGLQILRAALQENWLSGTPLPLEYQMLFDIVWSYNAESRNEPDYDDIILNSEAPVDNEATLLINPLFESWYLESGAVYQAAQELLTQDVGLPLKMTDQSWHTLLPMVIKLAHSEFNLSLRQCYAHRLNRMSEWLQFAGQADDARLAASAAKTMLLSPPEANLFVLSLVQKGLLVALANLASNDDISV